MTHIQEEEKVKQIACSKAVVQRYQMTCRPDWPQALTCTRLRDMTHREEKRGG